MNINKLLPFFVIVSLLFAGSMEQTFTFSEADFTVTKENNFDLLLNQEGLSTFEQGAPLLPIFSRYILIPSTAEIELVEIKETEKVILPQDFAIYPCQPSKPISNNEDEKFDFIPPNPAIYAATAPYPGKLFDIVPSGSKSGYRIAGIILYPFQYLPSLKKIEFYKKLKLQIHYQENVHPLKPLTQAQKKVFSDGIKSLVINPEAITEYSPPDKDSPDELDYLVITSSALVPHFQPFLDWKNKKGIITKIITTDTIYLQYSGRDEAEKVRNCIKDYFVNYGLKFVLLGGDYQVVPLRYGCVPYGVGTTNIAADLYFADLDNSWDGNQNNQFGEMTGDSVDLFADVYVGRASVDAVVQVQTFIHKDTLFEKHPDTTYLKSVLFPSAWLWSNIGYHGHIVNDYIAQMLGPEWRTTNLINPASGQTRDHINQGYEFCHISGHGSVTSFSSIFTNSEISQLTNTNKLSIFNSIACLVGRFDYTAMDCIAESLVNYPNGGCVAAVLNSREGYGAPPCFGPSENLDVAFFSEILNHPEIGIALANAKDRYRNILMTQISYRWCGYALNLFGDPSLMTWRERPKPVSVIQPDSIRVGPQVVQIQVRSDGLPLKDALVCIKGQEAYARDYTNSQGWVTLLVNPTDTGEVAITVTAPDHFPYENLIPIRGDGMRPSVVIRHSYVDDANNRLDPAETVDLFIVLENLGNAQAESVSAVLTCLNPFITIFDSFSDYGNIDIADTAYGDRYLVSASANTPMGSLIEFYLTVNERNNQWQHYFTLIVGERERSGIWANHDTGNCLLCVTALGSIGTIDRRGEGIGMIYPKNTQWSISRLILGSLLLGTDSSYIADRFYGVPCSIINQDFRLVDSLRNVQPAERGDQEYKTVFDDSCHPNPKGIKVTQKSYSISDTSYDDFVVMEYKIENRGTQLIDNLYTGICCDFKMGSWNTRDTLDIAGTDSLRRFAFQTFYYGETTAVGIRLLYPTAAANVSVIDYSRYVQPAGMMSEAVKDSFLKGLKRINHSDRIHNWLSFVSAGPFTIQPGYFQIVAFALCGGRDTLQTKINSDTAQSWYDNITGIKQTDETLIALNKVISDVQPRITNGTIKITYSNQFFLNNQCLLYDASGRLIKKFSLSNPEGLNTLSLANLKTGIYFLGINNSYYKIILLK